MNIQTPNARNNDPESSHLAGEEFTESGKRKSMTEYVAGLVKSHEGSTASELAAKCGKCICKISKRLNDANGVLIKKGESRKCTVSNRMVDTWWMA